MTIQVIKLNGVAFYLIAFFPEYSILSLICYPSDANEEDDDGWRNGSRQVKRSNSIQRMVQRLDSNSSLKTTRTRVAPAYQDDDSDDDETYFAPSNVYANPYRTISNVRLSCIF